MTDRCAGPSFLRENLEYLGTAAPDWVNACADQTVASVGLMFMAVGVLVLGLLPFAKKDR